MSLSEPFDDRLQAELAAAADGTLDPARQAEIEALADADPELAEALDRQRRAAALIRGATAGVHASPELRARIAADEARQLRLRRLLLALLAGGAALLLVVVLVVL